MACGQCGGENREGAQFCAACGASLVDACPSCGAVPARPGARFCDSCGAELTSAAHGSGAQSRKVVTVLFADLVGSTAAQEAMDPESVRRWIDRYYAVLRGEVESHGGRVVKFIGDGMMAVFGVPDVREDDADRAVAAAQAMHLAVADLGSAVPGGNAIGLRVGVNTGEVVVTADDDDVVGDAVNVAARLEQAARPGEVLVGDATFRLVRTRAQLRAVPPLDLKGKAEPVPAFLLLSLERTEEDTSASPFVGRAGELERLTAVLDVAIDDRRPQLASIVGAPGVGKSRLVQELGVAAASRARVVVVRCDPAGGATFAPVAAAIRAAASLDDDASDDTVLAGLTALFDDDEPDRHRIATGAAAILGVGEPGLPEETFWAVRRLIENAARRQALVFVFEDVHWAEPLLIDLIENLATFARDVPVLMVVTARPELREQRPGLVEVGGRVAAVLHLEGLAVDESRRLTRALLDGASLPTALLDRVTSASEGNPLFVRELVRMLVDDGVLRQHDGSWTAAVDARSVEVPLSIHSVLAARIDRLPAEEQEVLGAASVMGRTFARGAVLHLVSPEVGARLDDHLEGLRRKELVERAGTYWLDEPQLRFHHALVQDAAYRRLLKEARADLHTRAAAWLEQKVGDLAEHDDLIGYQLEQAHLLRTEAGDGDAEVGRAAADRLRQAGRRALEADDRPGAAALLGRALTCLADADESRAELLIERCEALLAMGDVTDATPAVAALAAIAPGDPRLEGWASCFEGELANLRDPGHLEATAERAAAAAVALAGLGDHAGTAKAHSVRAASLARLGRIGECERALDQALGAARAAGDRRRATAILAGAPNAALWGPNPVTRASGRCLDVVRVLRITSRAPAVEAISLRCQAVLEALRGRDDAARRMLASARSSLEELGHALGLIEVDLAAGMVETLAGDLDTAAKLLERAFEGFHELGIDVDAGLAAALLARVRIAQGAPAEALALTLESERLGGDDLKTAIAWRSVRAAALADEGDLVEARRLAEEAVALAAPTDALVDHADALVALAEVLAHAGEEAASRAAARQALELYERKEATVPADNARWLLGPEGATEGRGAPGARFGEPGPTVAAPILTNVAVSAARRVAAALSPFDRTAMEAATADMAMYDLRPLVGSDEPADVMEVGESIAAIGVTEVRFHPRAVRGEHLALLEGEFVGPVPDGGHEGVGLRTLHLVESTPDGRLRLNLVYEPEQADEAWRELERRYCEQLPPAEAELWSSYTALLAATAAGDWAFVEAHLAEDLVAIDHRPAGWGTLDAEAYVGLYRAAADLGPAPWLGATEVLVLTPHGLAGMGERVGTNQEGGAIRSRISVAVHMVDGCLVRTEYFPEDRPDLAIACVRSFQDGGSPVENAATRFVVRFAELAFTDRVDEVLAEVRPDVRVADHRPIVGGPVVVGRESYEAVTRSMADIGVTAIEHQILGVRGERLCLALLDYRGASAASELLAIVEVDEHGHLAGNDLYELDQRAEAWAELERRYLVQLGSRSENRASRVLADLRGHAFAGRFDEVAARCSADLRAVDYRPVVGGTVEIGGERYVELIRALIEVGVTSISQDVRGLRGECLFLGHFDYRGVDTATELLGVAEIDEDGLLTANSYYELDQHLEAWAELEERYLARLEPADAEIWAACIPLLTAMVANDWDGMRSALAEDFAGVDHRSAGWGAVNREEYIGLYVAAVDLAPDAWFGFSDVHLITPHGVAGTGEGRGQTVDGGEFVTAASIVFEAADGRVARTEYFPADRPDLAVAYLRSLDEPAPVENRAARIARRGAAALASADWDTVQELMSPDVVGQDLRPIVGTEHPLLGPEDVFASMRGIIEIGVNRIDLELVATRGDRWCLMSSVYGTEDTGVPLLEIYGIDAEGRICRSANFDPEQRDQAFALLDALASADADARFAGVSSASFPIENDVTRKYERAISMVFAGVPDPLRDVRDDLISIDHRPILGGGGEIQGKDTALGWLTGLADIGFATAEAHVLATRGERLGLILSRRFADEATLEVVTLAEADEQGLCRQIDVYEPSQLDEAMAHLDERYAAVLPEEHRSTWEAATRTWLTVNTRDLQGLLDACTPDSQIIDHRPASWGTLEREQWADVYPPVWAQAPDTRWWFRQLRGLSSVGVFGDYEVTGTRDGGDYVVPMLIVFVVRDGLVAQCHLFSPEAGAEAQACFDELPTSPDDGNEALRLAEVWFTQGLARDWDAVTSLMSPDVVITDHRPLLGGLSQTGHDGARAFTESVMASGVRRQTRATVALRGERLALARSLFEGERGSVEVLVLTATDGRARITEVGLYEPTQLDEALARLDDLFLAGEGAVHADTWRMAMRFLATLGSRDLDRVAATLTEDYALDDHRSMSFGALDRERYLASFVPAYEGSPDIRWVLGRDLGCARGVALAAVDIVGTRDGGSFRSPLLAVLTARGDQLAHLDVFGVDDLEAARACFAERSARHDDANEAVRLHRSWSAQMYAGDRDAMAGSVAPDVLIVDHRPLVGGVSLSGLEGAIAWAESATAAGVLRDTTTTVAMRGDRLALVRSVYEGDQGSAEVLSLLATDGSGHITYVGVYDLAQLDEAMVTLDERFLDHLPADRRNTWRAVSRLTAAMGSQDPIALRAAIGPDGGLDDRRPLSWETLEAEAWAEVVNLTWEEAPDVRYVVTSVAEVGRSVALFDLTVRGTRDGGPFEVPNIVVLEVTPKQGARGHTFVPEARAEAEACFAERVARDLPVEDS